MNEKIDSMENEALLDFFPLCPERRGIVGVRPLTGIIHLAEHAEVILNLFASQIS